MASMKLVVIPHTDWPKLRDLFLNGNEIPFNAVQNCINWRVRDPEIQHLQILGLGETWRENGTFILRDRHELYFFTLEQSNESLEHVLELINWSSSYRIVGITKQNQTALESVLTRMNKLSSEEHLMEADLYVKVLNKKEIDVEPPLGFRLGSLETCHAPYLNALSDYPNSKSEFTISRYITWNPNVALFNEHDELVAWCLLNNLGIISLLHTHKRYRRRGFAEIVLKAMIAKLVDRNMNARAAVTSTNNASVGLFEKVGFRRERVLHYIHYNG